MGGQAYEYGVSGKEAYLGIIDERPTIVSADGHGLTPHGNERRAEQPSAETCEHLAVCLQFEVKAVAKRCRNPQEKDRLPRVFGRRPLPLGSDVGGN